MIHRALLGLDSACFLPEKFYYAVLCMVHLLISDGYLTCISRGLATLCTSES